MQTDRTYVETEHVEIVTTVVTTAPEPKNDVPKHGDTKDGKIYINGFGWVKNEGGEVQGETAADIYQNGNKIGSFG